MNKNIEIVTIVCTPPPTLAGGGRTFLKFAKLGGRKNLKKAGGYTKLRGRILPGGVEHISL